MAAHLDSEDREDTVLSSKDHPHVLGTEECALYQVLSSTFSVTATMAGSRSIGLKGVKRGVPSHKGPLRVSKKIAELQLIHG